MGVAETELDNLVVANKYRDQPPTEAQAATVPPADQYRKSVDQDWSISMLMELQKTVGSQDATLKHVLIDVTELKRTVSRLENVIYAATAIFVIGGGALGWMINAAKELYIATHATEAHLQEQQQVPYAQVPPAAPRRPANAATLIDKK